jgi:hypothetical protein
LNIILQALNPPDSSGESPGSADDTIGAKVAPINAESQMIIWPPKFFREELEFLLEWRLTEICAGLEVNLAQAGL